MGGLDEGVTDAVAKIPRTALAAHTSHNAAAAHTDHHSDTATPIKHLVVIFDENVSFDHYFGTYPFAASLPGEMSDNMYNTTFGPSTPGAFSVVAGQTYGTICGPASATINDSPCTDPPGLNATDPTSSNITTSASGPTTVANQPAAGSGTTFSDADPTFDICTYVPNTDGGDGRSSASTITMGRQQHRRRDDHVECHMGMYEGGFDNGFVPGQGAQPTTAQICSQSHKNVGGNTVVDYIPHHEPFQYWASTANPMHLPPTSVAMVGQSDQANHQYDSADFWAAADSSNLPAVSYLKAQAFQDGHGGYSDPADEQTWLVDTINHLQSLPTWRSTAIIVTYDDSDGWCDHVLAPILTGSQTGARW